MTSATITIQGAAAEVYARSVEDGWGDGLPVIPPTADLVDIALTAYDGDPETVVGPIPPSQAEATVRDIAINAVMAGCRPEYLPVVVAAIRATTDPRLNTYGMQATTNPVTIAGFVNGPIIEQLRFNYSWGCLGPGNRANATIGRAVRFVLQNVGAAIPGQSDKATHGWPGKFSFFFAENQEESPWPPYHTTKDFDADVSTVTMFGASGFLNMLEPTSDPEDLAKVMALSMSFPTSNDYLQGGEPWLILSPEHAQILARGRFSSQQVLQEYLFAKARVPYRDYSKTAADYWVSRAWTQHLGELHPDTLVPPSFTPDGIGVVVAGGPSIHTAYIPSFGHNLPITVAI
jgi:hypothetical protein